MIPFFITMPISRMIAMKAMIDSSMPVAHSAIRAPSPAEGRVEMIVSGWIRLSYSTPSTM